ncbi:carboxylating nicotinate-nucleotide diphosphorylase [filamentous cyanobacterium LEGE 11480]|uniref:Probable nicotinate-nucleotide pyrophosphorylase [carboxylating] n=1 Tax=Romeriopsis navalis LEGE 11480 TaxID=2777977 RepID=A0A928VK89_9CYAN|nr:carboxylating nicotinate-nucleotide diphosphorylase [Romeriopsis navalis]MBE9030148.1 carboxylating nicotinate-nucleotide diphosphorylase [Romeriopsis navalis LEGE 11480]
MSPFPSVTPIVPPSIILDPMIQDWLREDIGRGDRATQALLAGGRRESQATWVAKQDGVIAGMPIAARVFQLLDADVKFEILVADGTAVKAGTTIAQLSGGFDTLLMGERVALNLGMRLSGIATVTRQYVEQIADLPTRFADTRKTTPGLRLVEKYASQVGGAANHRMGLDDSAMIKENHIAAAGGIEQAIALVRAHIPYPMTIEVETENLEQVREAFTHGVDIIMLDNMDLPTMAEAVQMIRAHSDWIRIEGSGNVSLETIRGIAETGVDYISSSGPITRSTWLDLSMRFSA